MCRERTGQLRAPQTDPLKGLSGNCPRHPTSVELRSDAPDSLTGREAMSEEEKRGGMRAPESGSCASKESLPASTGSHQPDHRVVHHGRVLT